MKEIVQREKELVGLAQQREMQVSGEGERFVWLAESFAQRQVKVKEGGKVFICPSTTVFSKPCRIIRASVIN